MFPTNKQIKAFKMITITEPLKKKGLHHFLSHFLVMPVLKWKHFPGREFKASIKSLGDKTRSTFQTGAKWSYVYQGSLPVLCPRDMREMALKGWWYLFPN